MSQVRVFYAAKKGVPEGEVEERRAAINAALLPLLPGKDVTVTAAAADFEEHFSKFGTWEGWQLDVATGVRFNDRQPRYHLFAVSDREVGRSTAATLQQALEAKKTVLFFAEEAGVFYKVRGIDTIDTEDWKSGWRVHT